VRLADGVCSPPARRSQGHGEDTDTPGGALAAFLRVLPELFANGQRGRCQFRLYLRSLVERGRPRGVRNAEDIQCGGRKLGPVISKRIVAAMA
jgi:hypothetical protein